MPSHRPIVPSDTMRTNVLGDSSSATASGSGNTESATGASSGRWDSGDSGAFHEAPKKRRAPGAVAAIACIECRKARQKCDGSSPHTCTRCQTRHLECCYEPHTKTRKELLLQEIANLKQDNTRLKTINREFISDANDLKEQHQGLQDLHDWQQIILDILGRNGHDRDIIKKLRAGESSESIARWLCQQQHISSQLHIVPPEDRSLLDIVSAFEHHYRREDGLGRDRRSDTMRLRWTEVTASQTLLGHLFDLYFTWVHPVHMLFSEIHFIESFRTNNETYCSPALVNAMCAMACHLVDASDLEEDVDVDTLAQAFMNQARQEVLPQNYTLLTSVQALAVMYLADLSSGKARSATGYLRASVEFLKAAELDGQSPAAREISLWGIQTLNTSSTGITYQKLYAPELPHMARFQHVDIQSDKAVWRFYRTVGDQRVLPVRPSHAIMTARYQAALFRIIHESLNLYCGLRGVATAEGILNTYRRYLDWEHDLPPILKIVDVEAQPVPHILFLHIQYHVAVVQHLTPLLQSGFFEGPNLQELRRLVIQHAQSGVELLEHYRRLYSARYLIPLLCFCIIHLGDALIRYSPEEPPASNTVEFSLMLLQQASVGFPICGPLQELFKRTAVDCGAKMPANVDEITGPLRSYGVDDILDACTRLDYKQPVDQSTRHIDDNIAVDWPSKWQEIVNSPNQPETPRSTRRTMSTSTTSSSGNEQHMRIASLLNR
ncbi:MAG: hypothetical protein L6R38_009731 [Xanthoria sp. 2 TBL-2021]|nr:MAG: hypothetical protein L6R38_009731 [Xanthoria sp. 2 TBL-2021]